MIAVEDGLVHLLELVDAGCVESEDENVHRGVGKTYTDQTMFKVYVVGLLKHLYSRRGVWRYLSNKPQVAQACGLTRIPDRRTLDRRLDEIIPYAERQIEALGLILSLETVTDSTVAASDGSAFAARGPVWHKKQKEAGIIPEGLHGLDTEADWIQSTYHGWVYGYKAHVTLSAATTTVRAVLTTRVTGSACESHVLKEQIPQLPPLVKTLLLDAGYDDGDLLDCCCHQGIEVLSPLSKAIGVSTSQARRERHAYLATPEGKARYSQRGSTIEPFFATIKALFEIDPLPVQGIVKATVFILLALYCWNLVVLFNFIHNHPLGAVKSVLELL